MINRRVVSMIMVALAPLSVIADENADYRYEMQQQMQAMSSEERDLFRSMNSESLEGMGNRYGSGSGDGSGQQKRYRNGGQASGPQDGTGNRYGAQGGGGGYGRGRANR